MHSSSRAGAFRLKRALIVDSSPLVRCLLGLAIECHGFDVADASPEELTHRRGPCAREYDFVFVDAETVGKHHATGRMAHLLQFVLGLRPGVVDAGLAAAGDSGAPTVVLTVDADDASEIPWEVLSVSSFLLLKPFSLVQVDRMMALLAPRK